MMSVFGTSVTNPASSTSGTDPKSSAKTPEKYTTSDENPKSSVTIPENYTTSDAVTYINNTVANTNESTQKRILFY